MSDMVWPAVVLIGLVLAYVRTGRLSGDPKLEGRVAKLEADHKNDVELLVKRLNKLTTDMNEVAPVLPHYAELVRRLEEVESGVSTLKTKGAAAAMLNR